tara:strand:+ start:2403 stop:3197 length:795 start_codon:yes stop_codon:yes gene_type:complete
MGCPKAKERVDKHLEAYKELKAKEPTPSLWDISRRFDWGYKTREAFELYEKKKSRATKPRVCNFCYQGGHNKRSCPSIKEIAVRMADANVQYRKVLLEWLSASGIGVGTLMKKKNMHYWDQIKGEWVTKDNVLCMITGICWRGVGFLGNNGPLYMSGYNSPDCLEVFYPLTGKKEHLEIPYWEGAEHPSKGKHRSYYEQGLTLVAAATPLPPENWIDGTDIADTFVKLLKKKGEDLTGYKSRHGKGGILDKWSKIERKATKCES